MPCKFDGSLGPLRNWTGEMGNRNPSISETGSLQGGLASKTVSKQCVQLRAPASINNKVESDRGTLTPTVELHVNIHTHMHTYTIVFECCSFKVYAAVGMCA